MPVDARVGLVDAGVLGADEAVHEVRETVIHELGHYFGLDDDEMPH